MPGSLFSTGWTVCSVKEWAGMLHETKGLGDAKGSKDAEHTGTAIVCQRDATYVCGVLRVSCSNAQGCSPCLLHAV